MLVERDDFQLYMSSTMHLKPYNHIHSHPTSDHGPQPCTANSHHHSCTFTARNPANVEHSAVGIYHSTTTNVQQLCPSQLSLPHVTFITQLHFHAHTHSTATTRADLAHHIIRNHTFIAFIIPSATDHLLKTPKQKSHIN
eukprot:553853-Amphidinium_carterae.1